MNVMVFLGSLAGVLLAVVSIGGNKHGEGPYKVGIELQGVRVSKYCLASAVKAAVGPPLDTSQAFFVPQPFSSQYNP